MSVQASLCVFLNEYDIMEVINVYLRCGLSVFDSENRAYVYISDGDNYDWEYMSVTFDELTGIILDKERSTGVFADKPALIGMLRNSSRRWKRRGLLSRDLIIRS